MKKRMISFILACVLVLSLGAAAFAAEMTTEVVTVKKGDTMYSLCKEKGFNYYTYKELLIRLNGMKDEKELAKLYVGKKIQIPVSKEAADELSKALNIKEPEKEKKNLKGAEAFLAADGTKVCEGDSVKYHIVTYALKKDENLAELIKSWGMKFNDYSAKILTLNDMKDFNHIAVGRTLLLPTTKLDIPDATYYTVMEHNVVKGDTAYSICQSYGLNYSKVLSTLEKLNPNVTFTRIRVNQKLYIPVCGIYNPQAAPSPSPAVPSASPAPAADYTSYGIIVSIGQKLCLRPVDGSADLNLTVLSGAFAPNYIPRIGDYILFSCDRTAGTLKAAKYVYNTLDNSAAK